MKARVKATGEIVDGNAMVSFQGDDFYLKELEVIQDDPDYWTRLEHQAAIAAMQGVLANNDLLMQLLKRAKSGSRITHIASEFANACAHIFVEKLKEKEERK